MSIEQIIETVTVEEIESSQQAADVHAESDALIGSRQMIMIAFD